MTKLKHTLFILLIALLAYGVSILWWRAWMYQGVFGPIPLMHWLMSSDGEGAYRLIELDMFLQMFAVLLLTGLGYRRLTSRS
ncbi:hypothetical protein CWE14_02115 [Aliidiomarina soli]|uniref:Uncharacterized protein n=1 Tax=Aliidiomarina soli TaxID=1928574 RepID=A0A432WM10_9GAMM|nr:hypothetical protein CWE14_02115 [Aliidiomarina soli]